MITLIAGASHTGKTRLAQRLLERDGHPYLSMDHLKMGLIRSGRTSLTPESSEEALTACLWPIVREMIKTAVENHQHLIVEGCYIPFDWQADFSEEYLSQIRYVCLVMSEDYIRSHFKAIRAYADIVETRLDDGAFDMETAVRDNARTLRACRLHALPHLLIDDQYRVEPDAIRWIGAGRE